ncbi:MAG: hypothetical protein KF764_12925 [Labilithrix sp.]|nr:hypothetical protein [Labilithrix sp.]
MRCLAFAFASLLGLSLVPRTAAAGELRYRAPAACPSREAVQQGIDARAPRARAVELTIETGAADKAFVGEAVVGTGDDTLRRRLEGQTCEAVVDAMLLVLALDRPTELADAPAEAPSTTTTSADVTPPRSVVTEAPGGRDEVTSSEAVDPRSSIEIALGTSSIARRLDAKTVFGSELFVEIGAPAALAPWYRPTARAGMQFLSEFHLGDDEPDEARLLAAGVELCPLGVAAVSTRRIDLTFSACGVSNLGSATTYASRAWVDAGAIARANMQIGRKGHFRGFVGVDGGILQRLGDPLLDPDHLENRRPTEATLVLRTAHPGTMWTLAVSGGVLFP